MALEAITLYFITEEDSLIEFLILVESLEQSWDEEF